ncbi:MAG: flagellar biosynthesis protein FlhF [Catonella sp.]|uniref:flagellar biosynthesis protein FlhF n=1 Tax=Catonella sp. TaxID=2382125 RepID=UPI003FA18253
MIIKKFKAETEKDAILLAKEELGGDAVVMNIKTTTPKGFFSFLRKPYVEVTAAIDENMEKKPKLEQVPNKLPEKPAVNEVSAIEKKLNDLQGLLEKQLNDSKIKEIRDVSKVVEQAEKQQEVHGDFSDSIDIDKSIAEDAAAWDKGAGLEKKESNLTACMQLIYKQLKNNEVDEKYIKELTGEIENSIKKDAQLDRILGAVYQKLVLKLGQPSLINIMPGKTKYVFFLGPTGVGKTTTIAKIASAFKIKEKRTVGLLTADTYRIAAVEQLRTYANILGVPLSVVYSAGEIAEARKTLDKYEVVLVDTAGRSDKNKEQIDELKRLISAIPEEDREVYLVLSATTKYGDLNRITEVYKDITNYKIIFTKVDETGTIGNIYNILMRTGSGLSYVTFGQNVPDDICAADTQAIAKQLLS